METNITVRVLSTVKKTKIKKAKEIAKLFGGNIEIYMKKKGNRTLADFIGDADIFGHSILVEDFFIK